MALFKISKGDEANLPIDTKEGFAYFTPDTGNFFIDVADSEEDEFQYAEQALGSGKRVQLNANHSYTANTTSIASNFYMGETSDSDDPGWWTTEIEGIHDYYDGLIVAIQLTTDGNFVYDSLSINDLPPKVVYASYGNLLYKEVPANNTMWLVYRKRATNEDFISSTGPMQSQGATSDGFILLKNTDLNYYDRIWEENHVRYTDANVGAFELVMADGDGLLHGVSSYLVGDQTRPNKQPTNKYFRPEHIWFFDSGSPVLPNPDMPLLEMKNLYSACSFDCRYTFNESFSKGEAIYLVGDLDANTGLFLLDKTATNSWYLAVPMESADLVLSDYFTEGKYYIYVGAVGDREHYMTLSATHPMFYFTKAFSESGLTQTVARARISDILEGVNEAGDTPIQWTAQSIDTTYNLHRKLIYEATSVEYNITLDNELWDKTRKVYTVEIEGLTCGGTGLVSPLIVCRSNPDEYCFIYDVLPLYVTDPDTGGDVLVGLEFYSDVNPQDPIDITIIDIK